MASIRKQLLKIQASESLEQLIEFTQPDKLVSIPLEELELLAQLLTLLGSQQLSRGETTAMQTFEQAAKIVNYSSSILYKQAMIYASYSANLRCLKLAKELLSNILKKEPDFLKARYQHALVLLQIAIIEKETPSIYEASQAFEATFKLITDHSSPLIDLKNFYWKWGFCLAEMGRIEGEPLDFHQAITKFSIAQKNGLKTAEFFSDYGLALIDLAMILKNSGYLLEALKYFTELSLQDPDHFNGWFYQACCLQQLNDFHTSLDYLESADSCFGIAAQIDASSSLLWLKWGELEATLGKAKVDFHLMENSWLKFEKSFAIDPTQPLLLNAWAESELFVGVCQEKLELILSCKDRVQKSLYLQSDLPKSWHLLGICLNELGHYFEEETYYLQAIEKFQYGLSLASKDPFLWYGMALAHYALGELKNDRLLIQKATRFCSYTIECGGGMTPQFWNDWGVALLKLGEMNDQIDYVASAIEKFEKALSFQKNKVGKELFDLEWAYHHGCALDLMGELSGDHTYFEKSIQVLKQVVQLAPEDKEARYNYALALYHLADALWEVEEYQRAIHQFEILSQNDPEDATIQVDFGVTLTSFALLIRDEHEFEKEKELFSLAEAHLVQGAALGNYQAFYHLAGLYSLNHLFDQSIHCLEKSLFFGCLPPKNEIFRDNWLQEVRQTTAFKQFLEKNHHRLEEK